MLRTLSAAVVLLALQSQQTPVFRTGANLVRLDVVVTDTRTGKPITDLTARDFTIRENGTPQRISLFVNEPLVPAADSVAPSQAVVRGGAADARSRRVFLFYPPPQQIGIGGPVRPLEGAVSFIREQLLPQDLVGTIAFNRVTDLTTDHEYVARVIERFKDNYRKILFEWFQYNSMHQRQCYDVPPHVQAMIDALFESEPQGAHRPRSLVPLITGTAEFHYADEQLRCSRWNARMAGNSVFGVYAGIEYLRPVTGQKHLIAMTTGFLLPGFVTYGLFLRDASDEARLAARANDAEVALDVVDTAGTRQVTRGISPPFSRMSLMNMSELGGGQFTSTRTAAEALRRLDDGSRHSYLVGYVPADPSPDGTYRKLEVLVNRRNATLSYRRGYTAGAEVPALDLRAIETSARLREAAATDAEQRDIAVKVEAALLAGDSKNGQVRVTLTIDGSRLAFTLKGDKREGVIDVLILCGDKDQNVVGRIQHKLAMSLDEQKYQRALAEGMPYTVTVPITGPAAQVKAVVYEYESDRVGTAVSRLK